MKQMEVTIMGQTYLLVCPEGGEERLQQAVQRVDREMCAIRDAGKVKARERIAVLAALNLAFGDVDAKPGAEATADPQSDAAAPTADLGALIQRIDRALHEDGQLI